MDRVRSMWRKTMRHPMVQNALSTYGRYRHHRISHSAPRDQHHHYTCFYRSPLQLEALTGPVLDFLLQHHPSRQLDITVLGCSNGAEPYTIAACLMQYAPQVDFRIRASDIDAEMVLKAETGEYTENEVTKRGSAPAAFLDVAFDREGSSYRVKPSIRSRLSFQRMSITDDALTATGPSDIVFAQNIFFHIEPDLVTRAFQNVYRIMKPSSALFVDGMDLDMRESLTRSLNLIPLDYRVHEIHEEARKHTGASWWRYYWGCEPYSRFVKNPLRRYATIFLKNDEVTQ
jgi:chemotaxis methyl-accepting protein methylase